MGYTAPNLEVRKVSSGWKVYGPSSTTGDDLFIYANLTDTYSQIEIRGDSGIYLRVPNAQKVIIADSAAELLSLSDDATDTIFDTVSGNKNVYLKPHGTGLVKFGAYTAGAATDSTGYISILDAAGNARKLMVQA